MTEKHCSGNTSGVILHFPGSKYHMYKAEVKKVIGHFDLKWNYGRSGWFGELGSVVGEFQGSGRPVRLIITDGSKNILGDCEAISLERVMTKLAEVIGVEVENGIIEVNDDKSYYVVNRNHYVNRQYEELIERGCDEIKARRLNESFGEAFDKVFKQEN